MRAKGKRKPTSKELKLFNRFLKGLSLNPLLLGKDAVTELWQEYQNIFVDAAEQVLDSTV